MSGCNMLMSYEQLNTDRRLKKNSDKTDREKTFVSQH